MLSGFELMHSSCLRVGQMVSRKGREGVWRPIAVSGGGYEELEAPSAPQLVSRAQRFRYRPRDLVAPPPQTAQFLQPAAFDKKLSTLFLVLQ